MKRALKSILGLIRLGRLIVSALLPVTWYAAGREPAIKTNPGISQDSTAIYLVRHGWHSGIVLPAEALASAGWPAQSELSDCGWLEVGWGDKRYYMAEHPTWWQALRAAVLPTASVLHMVCVDAPVREYFSRREILEFHLDPQSLNRLSRYISSRFFRGAGGGLIEEGAGLYGRSRFYLGSEKFHLFKTCNTWTGRGLKQGGVPLSTFLLVTAKGLHRRAGKFGRKIHSH